MNNKSTNDLRTQAIVLRRTNYGESDRILNLLTPEGKFSVLAKGVRKEKSKLAGGIELFSVGDVVIHRGHSSLSILTSAKLISFYSNILSDLTSLELASTCLKKVEKAADSADNPDYFSIMQQTLAALNDKLPHNLVRTWFTLNLAQALGESINLSVDVSGDTLNANLKYFWDGAESALRPDLRGTISAQQIKLARLILSSDFRLVSRIANAEELVDALLPLARAYEHI